MILRHYELSCDVDQCWTAYQAGADEVTSLAATRRGARAAGWGRIIGKDLCPAHSPARGEGTT